MLFRKKRRREENEGEPSYSKRARTCDLSEPQHCQQPTVISSIKSWFRRKVTSISDFIQKEVFISSSETEVSVMPSTSSTSSTSSVFTMSSGISQKSTATTAAPFKFTASDKDIGVPTPRAPLASTKQTDRHLSNCVTQQQSQDSRQLHQQNSGKENFNYLQRATVNNGSSSCRDANPSKGHLFDHENIFNVGSGTVPHSSNSKFSKGSYNRKRRDKRTANSTLKECIRQAERQKYLQLIQQYTSVPVTNVKAGVDNKQKDWSFLNKTQKNPFDRQSSTNLGSKLSESAFSSPLPSVPSSAASKLHVKPLSLFTPRFAASNVSTYRPEESIFRRPCSTPVESFKTGGENFLTSRFMAPVRFSEKKRNTEPQTDVIEIPDNSILNKSKDCVVKDKSESTFFADNWMRDLTKKYSAEARERERKILVENITVKIHKEKRDARDATLESQIRDRMKITDDVILEEPPYEESEEEVEPDEEETFPAITDDMVEKIQNAFHGGSHGEVLVEGFRLQITRNDILTLKELNWLNDEVINFYMNLLIDRGENDNYPSVYAFNTFFYPKIVSDGQSGVKRWTRKVDVFAKAYIVIPVHLGVHWCLAIVDFRRKEIRYYDSMGGNNMKCLQAIKKYLCDESMDKKKQTFDTSGWKLEVVSDIPQQMNGSDCGMFACKFAEYITRDAPITFDQRDMPYFRERMVYEILTKTLL